jgi:hypothetical protein
VEKFATLTNAGNSDFNTISLTTALASGTANVLTSDGTNGLQVTVEGCTTAWTAVANGADTCTGSKSVLAKSAILGTGRALGNLASITAGASDYLKITTSLPTSADNTFQGLGANVAFTFDATQRTATVK